MYWQLRCSAEQMYHNVQLEMRRGTKRIARVTRLMRLLRLHIHTDCLRRLRPNIHPPQLP